MERKWYLKLMESRCKTKTPEAFKDRKENQFKRLKRSSV
jgi:hypothetical protein